jgi:guanylate cyclase
MWDRMLSVGAYVGESDVQRGKRRIVVAYMWIGIVPRLIFGIGSIGEGQPLRGWNDLLAALIPVFGLLVLRSRPHWYVWVVNGLLLGILLENLAVTVTLGGLAEADMAIAWGFLVVVGALIALDGRAGMWWFLAFLLNVVASVVLTDRIEPAYETEANPASIAFMLIGITIFVYAGMAYFVHQRDRFQKESDDLLHNILPDEIATRLKSSPEMIADSYDSASVLFADVVDFTPMSTTMSPHEIVGLLNNLFSTFDRLVDELGLEKIKTVGDAYMVASGVATARSDHATAIAELALRMRDELAGKTIEGHQIRMRIGINSGPVVAGVVGTHKFAYDLWGDAVNTASRMESEGVKDSIQISEETHRLVNGEFVCEPRGEVSVKGKGTMQTYFLLSRKISAQSSSG